MALYGFLTFGVQVLGWLDPKAPSRLSEQASQVASITDGLSKVLKAGKP